MIYVGADTQVHTPVGIVLRGSCTWITIEISIHSFTGNIGGGPVGFLWGWFIAGQVFTAGWNETNGYGGILNGINHFIYTKAGVELTNPNIVGSRYMDIPSSAREPTL